MRASMKLPLLALLVTWLLVPGCERTSTAPEQPLVAARAGFQVPDTGWVATPAGWYHRSCVHEIPNGAHVSKNDVVTLSNGSAYQLPSCAYPHYSTAPGRGGLGGIGPLINSHWIEEAYDSLGGSNNYGEVIAGWRVPRKPSGSYSDSSVFYSFPGLQNFDSLGLYVLQPVIQYGYNRDFGTDTSWTANSWACDTLCRHGTYISITPGDSIYGSVTESACVNGTCTWTIVTVDVTKSTRATYTKDYTSNFNWVGGGVLETYGLTTCSQYPDTGVFYSGIQAYDGSGHQLTPSWTNYVNPNHVGPSCGFNVASTTSTVSLFYNQPPPPPPLSVSIYQQPPTYTAEPSGGYSPYSYYWEYCYSNCTGGAAPLAGAQAAPNLPPQGWQFLSINQSVSWSGGQAYLRVTVTDSHSDQAQDEIQVNGS